MRSTKGGGIKKYAPIDLSEFYFVSVWGKVSVEEQQDGRGQASCAGASGAPRDGAPGGAGGALRGNHQGEINAR